MSVLMIEPGKEFPRLLESDRPLRSFLVVIELGARGWGAYVPDLPGVAAAADTEEEVRALIVEAIEFHLDGLREHGQPIPPATSTATWVVA